MPDNLNQHDSLQGAFEKLAQPGLDISTRLTAFFEGIEAIEHAFDQVGRPVREMQIAACYARFAGEGDTNG